MVPDRAAQSWIAWCAHFAVLVLQPYIYVAMCLTAIVSIREIGHCIETLPGSFTG